MKALKILAIDPGFASLGWAVVSFTSDGPVCEAAGVLVSIGGKAVGTTPISEPVTLPVGEHIVTGTAGSRKNSTTVRIEAQATSSLDLKW